MTVAELKKHLANVPDTHEVVVRPASAEEFEDWGDEFQDVEKASTNEDHPDKLIIEFS